MTKDDFFAAVFMFAFCALVWVLMVAITPIYP